MSKLPLDSSENENRSICITSYSRCGQGCEYTFVELQDREKKEINLKDNNEEFIISQFIVNDFILNIYFLTLRR
ncbi:unnamed protein product, partial [Larinioides sclopetarius]